MLTNQKDLISLFKNQNFSVAFLSLGFLFLFVVTAFVDIDFLSACVDASFNFSVKYFGALCQVLLFATFFIAMGLAITKYGNVRLGGLDKPEFSTFRWLSMIICTLLAGGGVFWSAAEPMYHFLNVPPAFPGIEGGTAAAVTPALTQSFLHWGFYAWAILSSLGTIIIMYSCYYKKMPIAPRALIYPFMGEKGVNGIYGTLVDAFTIVATAAGTIGPIGFLGLQMSYAVSRISGVPDTFSLQLIVIAAVTLVYTLTAVTPIYKGINHVSFFNVLLTIFVILFILLCGPGRFIVDSFMSAMGNYLGGDFIRLALFRGDSTWTGAWTIFFFVWMLAYAPMMAVFCARVSRGRTIRELVLAVTLGAGLSTNAWFSVLGGAGIYYELTMPGSVSAALNSNGLPAALLSIIDQLPLHHFMTPVILVLVILYLVTTGAGMTYSMAMSISHDNPPVYLRVMWGVVMGAVAALLIRLGAGGISALQNFIVFTSVPLMFFFFPTLWYGPKCAIELYRSQNG